MNSLMLLLKEFFYGEPGVFLNLVFYAFTFNNMASSFLEVREGCYLLFGHKQEKDFNCSYVQLYMVKKTLLSSTFVMKYQKIKRSFLTQSKDQPVA